MSQAEAPAVSLPTNPSRTKVPSFRKICRRWFHPVADVDEPLVGELHAVDGVAEDRRRVRFLVVGLELAVDRRPAVGAPVALVLAGVGIEDDHPPVAVAVGDVDLIGLGVDADVGRAAQARRVVAAAQRAGTADLEEERPVAGELEHLPVAVAVAADPDVVEVVDENAVLVVRPLVAVAGTAPRLDDVALLVELDSPPAPARSTRTSAGRPPRAALTVGQRPGPVQHPDVVARVDRHADDVAEQPLVGERLRPEGVDLEHRPRGPRPAPTH